MKVTENVGVSIIICTYNGKNRLPKTLAHAINQRVDFSYEIIVVNNASNDGTDLWLDDFIFHFHGEIIIRRVDELKPGLTHARMKGVSIAHYPCILFCDDDNWLSPDYLKVGFDLFSSNPSMGVLGGLGIPVFEGIKPVWFEEYSHSYAVGNLGKKNGKQPFGSYHYGAACFFSSSALHRLQHIGFKSLLSDRAGKDLTSGGDVELELAIQLIGYELHFSDLLIFHHFIERHRLDWRYYLSLKKGISSSFPLLESYKVHEFPKLSKLRIYLATQFFIVLKGILKYGVLTVIKYSQKSEVNFIISKTKFSSFFTNYQKTLKGFKQNKILFES